jgi:arylsulfatase A-like enzyme
MARLNALGLARNTAIFLIADHGPNFADTPCRVVETPPDSMRPHTMSNPLLARIHPVRRRKSTQSRSLLAPGSDCCATQSQNLPTTANGRQPM